MILLITECSTYESFVHDGTMNFHSRMNCVFPVRNTTTNGNFNTNLIITVNDQNHSCISFVDTHLFYLLNLYYFITMINLHQIRQS